MMKSILISIKPQWCELIASGEKTIDVRKTRPKCDVPFKCYIYMTKDIRLNTFHSFNAGKVIGEFVCDQFTDKYFPLIEGSCLSLEKLHEYANGGNIYGWHISELVIYDKPKALKEFYSLSYQKKCGYCVPICGSYPHCSLKKDRKSITRPPQSWCYVEV